MVGASGPGKRHIDEAWFCLRYVYFIFSLSKRPFRGYFFKLSFRGLKQIRKAFMVLFFGPSVLS